MQLYEVVCITARCIRCRSLFSKTFGCSNQQPLCNSMTSPAGLCTPKQRIIELAVIGGHSGKVFSSLVNSERVRVRHHFPHACGSNLTRHIQARPPPAASCATTHFVAGTAATWACFDIAYHECCLSIVYHQAPSLCVVPEAPTPTHHEACWLCESFEGCVCHPKAQAAAPSSKYAFKRMRCMFPGLLHAARS